MFRDMLEVGVRKVHFLALGGTVQHSHVFFTDLLQHDLSLKEVGVAYDQKQS